MKLVKYLGSALIVLFIAHYLYNLNRQVKDPPKTVPFVDLSRYLGTWYQQSVIPFFWERGCERTRAKYSMNEDGTIKVDNICYRNGQKVESVGKAFPDPNDQNKTNAKLKVQFSETFNIQADYWIVRLDKDYTYAVVTTPNRSYLWILSRDAILKEEIYQSIYNDLKADGFPVEQLRRTKQIEE